MLLFCDSFDHYATADILKKWDAGSGVTIGAFGRGADDTNFVDNAAVCTTPVDLSKSLTPFDSTAGRTCIFGFALYPLVVTTRTVIARVDLAKSANGPIVLVLYPDFHLELRQGPDYYGSDALSLLLSTPSIYVNHWVYVEVKVSDVGTGCEIRIDKRSYGTRHLLHTSGFGAAVQWTAVHLGGGPPSDSATWRVDDLYVLDRKRVSQITYQGLYGLYQRFIGNETYWGPIKVRSMFPIADAWSVLNRDWTPLSGTEHYAMIDEAAPDGDTSYNSSEDSGDVDTYNFEDPLLGPLQKIGQTGGFELFALQWLGWLKAADTGLSIKPKVNRLSGLVTTGAAAEVPTDYAYLRAVLDRDPQSGGNDFKVGVAYRGDWFRSTMAGHAGQREFGIEYD